MGAFETDPHRIADIISGWLAPSNKAAFQEMGRRSKALGRPRAVYNIARDLTGLLEGAERLIAGGGSCCGRRQGGAAPAYA